MRVFDKLSYKIQLPEEPVGEYHVDKKYLVGIDEEENVVLFPENQVTPGELVPEDKIIILRDCHDDPVFGPHNMVSKQVLRTEQLVRTFNECIGDTLELTKHLGMVRGTYAVEVLSPTHVFVMNMVDGSDRKMSYKMFEREQMGHWWMIDGIIKGHKG